jgi:hypothetical protein
VTSTFKETVELKETATVDEYLDHNIRMVYQLETEGGFPKALAEIKVSDKKGRDAMVAAEIPLKWTGTMMKKADACRRVVYSGKQQVLHINGQPLLPGLGDQVKGSEGF